MFRNRTCWIFLLSAIIFSAHPLFSGTGMTNRVYGIVPQLTIRKLPSVKAEIVGRLRHGRWVTVIEDKNGWHKIKRVNGSTGYITKKLVSDTWIKILKRERRLLLMKGSTQLKSYTVGLGFDPNGDKVKQGDGCTPEGRFYICEIRRKPPPPETYGPVSLRISYPNIEDARRGLHEKRIGKKQYLEIVRAIHAGKMPPQNTRLGSSIKIHGGTPGSSGDWTLGCIALENDHLKELFLMIPGQLTLVDVYKDRRQDREYNSNGFVNKTVIASARALVKKGCKYTSEATKIIPLSFPMGDLDPSMGVCTDVVIRALRGANIDLQALLYEDILLHPARYPRIPSPNPNIDHRRTRNLKRYFDHNAVPLTRKPPAEAPLQWKAGDIVLMDTGISNGTIYDHIGIVSTNKRPGGIPWVINLWTVGWDLNEMELLNGDYPKIVGHYRLHHPFFY